MKGLLTKDFRILLQQKRFFAVLILIAGLLNFNTDGGFAVTYMTFMGLVFAMSTVSYDEYDNGMPFLMTLPVSRKIYVREKYLFGIILGFIMCLIGVALALGGWLVGNGNGDYDIHVIIANTVVSIPVFVMVISFMLPIQLKFGAEKGRIALFVLCGVILLICFGLKKLTELIDIDILRATEILLSRISMSILAGILLAAAAVVLLISLKVSRIIMEKKEF